MEDVLKVYALPYDYNRPVVCMDESCKQLVGEVREPIPMKPGQSRRIDDEYERKGVAQIFMAVEPLGGFRKIEVAETRKRIDWAHFVRTLVDEVYGDRDKIVLVMDNLNTHNITSLYAAFPPEEASRIADRLELHFTPKHGSWLNIAEIELSVYKRLCIDGRIPSLEIMKERTAIWNKERNNTHSKVNWQFTTSDARVKLRRLYPQL